VIGIPKAQPRPRAYRRGNRAAVYDPGTAIDWKSLIAIAARPYIPQKPIDAPIKIRIQYFLPRPKRLMRAKDSNEALPHTGKPDIDNLNKATFDILTQIGMWKDDSQIFENYSVKLYHSKDGRPGAVITISEFGGENENFKVQI
jgi:Holliday junction resolvase RusA-like endonuclease